MLYKENRINILSIFLKKNAVYFDKMESLPSKFRHQHCFVIGRTQLRLDRSTNNLGHIQTDTCYRNWFHRYMSWRHFEEQVVAGKLLLKIKKIRFVF